MFALIYLGFMLLVLGLAWVVVAYTLGGSRAGRGAAPGVVALPPKRLVRAAREQTTVLREVSDADIEWELRQGRLLSAIRLYQEQTGAGATEAKAAVDAWRERLRAS